MPTLLDTHAWVWWVSEGESDRLPGPFHGDPADQIIVATARDRDAVLVTKDRQIHQYAHVRAHW